MKKKTLSERPQDIVFELGTEELPATNLADLFESSERSENPLAAKWKKTLEDRRLGFESVEVWATPRRLVFYAKNVAASQSARDQLTKLLASSEAYGPDGQPSEKLLTILKHRNAQLTETIVSDVNGKPHVFIKKAEPVRKTASVLPELLEAFVPTMGFPKNMKWDASGLYFPRPIRSTLCFYGDQCVKYKVGETRSGDKTFVFSKSRRTAHAVADAASYFKVLKKQGVLLDPVERKKVIQAALEKLAKSFRGKLYDDPFLLNEVNYLGENPQALAAPFDAQFLKLPLEVLTVSMARKQRIFGLVDDAGRVLPRFLAITDRVMSETEKKLISRNYENILHAKLQDSLFFYKEDIKVPLEKKREELKNLVFLKGAGSMYDKSERLVALSKSIKLFTGGQETASIHLNALKRAASLCKSDLLTHMVGEFPELQGVMGKYYALANGEDAEVANAIGEQYLPRTMSDKIPASPVGRFLAVLDKIDLIAACFLLKMEPTSSLDPYGLRRSATGILKILLEAPLDISLTSLLEESVSLLARFSQKETVDTAKNKLRLFFQDRFQALLVERGIRKDFIEACMASGFDRPCETFSRLRELNKLGSRVEFSQACKVVERTSNILKGTKEALPEKPDPAVFAEPLEHAVLERFEKHKGGILQAKKEGDLARATSLYAEAFFDILNEFFDKVFINADDLNVRRNRLSLLRNVKELYTRDIADLSKIQSK